jgi:hypothetical protein
MYIHGKNKTYHQQCGVAMALSENEDAYSSLLMFLHRENND